MNITDILNRNWNMPTTCTCCNTPLTLNENGTRLYCPNTHCASYVKARVMKFCNVAHIREIGDTTLDKMIECEIISDVSSLFAIDYKKLGALIGTGNARNIKNEIDRVREMSLVDFIAGYNIEDCGVKVVTKILNSRDIRTFEQLETLFSHENDFVWSTELTPMFTCEGVGEITARKFVDGMLSNFLDMKYTLAHGLKIRAEEHVHDDNNVSALRGKSFCFTGKLNTMKRDDAQRMVIERGGEIKSVTRGLTYLVTNDAQSGSSKNEKARALNVTIIDENEFLQMLK